MVLDALAAPIAVPAGQSTTVNLPVPVDAAYSGDGWNVQAGGGTVSITAPAEGGQITVPVTYQGHSAAITLVAEADPEPAAGHTPGQAPVQDPAVSEGEAAGTGASASAPQDAPAADLPQVPGTKPAREAAAVEDVTGAEMIYLDSVIEGNTITAKLTMNQALDLYNRFGNLDSEQFTLRYLDGEGHLIKGVKREVSAASRTLTLTYPDGEAPDNPFIMQLVRKTGGVEAAVRLRDPNFAVADAPEEETKAQEAAEDSSARSAYSTGFIVGALACLVVLALIIVALVALMWRRKKH